MSTKELIVRSKERVIKYGEVFTPQRIVEQMLDLVDDECRRLDSKFLDPACGTGNFLLGVLKRKLKCVDASSKDAYRRGVFICVSSLYGIELLEDNVLECRRNIMQAVKMDYMYNFGRQPSKRFYNSLEFVVSKNIIWGDTLGNKCFDSEGGEIIFIDWHIDEDGKVLQIEHKFKDLLKFGDTTHFLQLWRGK